MSLQTKKINKDFAAVIIAGGKSARMDQDKALLPFLGYDSMAKYQYEKLKKIFQTVYISSKKDKFDFIGLKNLILDDMDIFSPMVALQSIFAKTKEQKLFIVTVDMPLVDYKTIYKLMKMAKNSKYEIVIAKDTLHNRHPLCGVFDRAVYPQIKKSIAKNKHKINNLVNSCNYCEIVFENEKQFCNINTPKEYKMAQATKHISV